MCLLSFSSFRLNPNSREPHYESEIEAMKPNESNTMFIDFSHVMRFNDVLQKAISDEFLRYFLQKPFFLDFLFFLLIFMCLWINFVNLGWWGCENL